MTKLCQCCCKRYFCKEVDTKEECNKFKSWIYTKNHGEVHRVENTKQITINNRIFNLVKIYKNFAKYKNSQGWYECFNFQELGLVKEEIKPERKIRKRKIL